MQTTLLTPTRGTVFGHQRPTPRASQFGCGTVRDGLDRGLASREGMLDGPTVGVDPAARCTVWDFVMGLREDLDMTVS